MKMKIYIYININIYIFPKSTPQPFGTCLVVATEEALYKSYVQGTSRIINSKTSLEKQAMAQHSPQPPGLVKMKKAHQQPKPPPTIRKRNKPRRKLPPQ